MRTLHGSRCFKVKRVRVIILCSLPSRSLMSLLNIPHCSFPQVLSSPSGSLSRPSASTTSWEEASASQLAGVGCLAEWLTQLQTQVMSPTPPTSVNTIHPAPEIHEHFVIQKATEHCAQPQAHFHLNWDHCDQLHERHDAHRRVHCAVLSTLRTVFRCVDLMRSYVTLAQGPRSVFPSHPWS